MAITLNGTTGISSPGGDTSTSLATTNLSYTGTLTGGTGVIAIGTTQIYKDASGNVGIGTASPSYKLDVWQDQNANSWARVRNSDTGSSAYSGIAVNAYGNSWGFRMGSSAANSNALQFVVDALGSPVVKATLDASGNLGIGASPTAKLTVSDGDLRLTQTVGGDAPGVNSYSLYFKTPSGDLAQLFATSEGGGGPSGFGGALRFYTKTNNSTLSERARIDSSGNLLVGTTSATAKFSVRADLTSAVNSNRAAILVGTTGADSSYEALAIVKNANNTANSNVFQTFFINAGNTASGYITANGANAAGFSSSSDSRLKENITVLPNQLDNICALKPSEFDYKDGSGHQIGFIAQEMEEVYPDCVAEDGDGMLMISGWSKTEARLVKAIQELTTRLEALEAKA